MFLIGNEGLYSKLLLTFYAEFTEDGSNRQIFRDKESLGGSSGVKETPVICLLSWDHGQGQRHHQDAHWHPEDRKFDCHWYERSINPRINCYSGSISLIKTSTLWNKTMEFINPDIQDTGNIQMVIFDRIQSTQIPLLLQRILNNVLCVAFPSTDPLFIWL